MTMETPIWPILPRHSCCSWQLWAACRGTPGHPASRLLSWPPRGSLKRWFQTKVAWWLIFVDHFPQKDVSWNKLEYPSFLEKPFGWINLLVILTHRPFWGEPRCPAAKNTRLLAVGCDQISIDPMHTPNIMKAESISCNYFVARFVSTRSTLFNQALNGTYRHIMESPVHSMSFEAKLTKATPRSAPSCNVYSLRLIHHPFMLVSW